MKNLLPWIVVGALFAAPTLWRYHFSDAATWVCEKGGTCHGEPTLYHRLGFSKYWEPDYPRIETMQIVPLSDLEHASVSFLDSGYVDIKSSDACWKRFPDGYSWCWGSGLGYWTVPSLYDDASPHAGAASANLAARFNAFRKDPEQRIFVHRRPRPFTPWQAIIYSLAAVLGIVFAKRAQNAKTRAWLDAVALIPPTPSRSPYRG